MCDLFHFVAFATLYCYVYKDNAIAAVDVEKGAFSGAPTGIPSFREGKIARVEAWLESMGFWWSNFERSWFYSDSLNDLPLLSRVSDPVAVDPDPTLLAHARSAGWPVLNLHTGAEA